MRALVGERAPGTADGRTVVDAVPKGTPDARTRVAGDDILSPRVRVHHERGEYDHLDADSERVQSVGDVRLCPVLRLMNDATF